MRFLLITLMAIPCLAQTSTLRVFSEFTRIDPFGNIVPQDRGKAEPRHILSPGVPRNAFSSFRVAISFDKPARYILDVGQNPENAVQVTVYKERFEKHGAQWIPDGLEPVKMPFESHFLERDIPGQKVVTFWVDMWVSADAEVDRIKVEPQAWLSYADDWFTYPMEVRILESVIPKVTIPPAALPSVTERADAAAIRPMRAALCGQKEPPGQAEMNARALIRRNTLQHLALQRSAFTAGLLKVSRAPSVKAWCSADPDPAGPEWYLRLRDSVVQAREPE